MNTINPIRVVVEHNEKELTNMETFVIPNKYDSINIGGKLFIVNEIQWNFNKKFSGNNSLKNVKLIVTEK